MFMACVGPKQLRNYLSLKVTVLPCSREDSALVVRGERSHLSFWCTLRFLPGEDSKKT